MPLPRLVPAPRGALQLADSLVRGAIDNARSAAAAIAEQVNDRRQLAPADEPGGSGTLSRIGRAEGLDLMRSRSVGRLAYIARPGVPDIVPVNYTLHGAHVLVRTGVGPKLQAAERGEALVLEVDDIDEATHTGWSVVATGPARRLSSHEIGLLPDGVLPRTWANGPRFALLQVDLKRVEGRRLS